MNSFKTVLDDNINDGEMSDNDTAVGVDKCTNNRSRTGNDICY